MRCIELLLLFFYLQSVVLADYEDKILQTFQKAQDDSMISNECSNALSFYIENLNSTSEWALRMFDATSKIPVGLLSYNLAEMGQFSQCLNTESPDGSVEARYCLGSIVLTVGGATVQEKDAALYQRILQVKKTSKAVVLHQFDTNVTSETKLTIPWAICVPSDCSNTDVLAIMSLLGSESVLCQTKEDLNLPLTAGAIGAIVVLAIFAFLLVASTALDLYYRHVVKKEPPHIILIAFSVYTNGQKLFHMNHQSSELTCVHGIRLYSMLWVIIGHVYSGTSAGPLFNVADIYSWIGTLRCMIIVSGTLSVDSFFLLSGTLLVYTYFKSKYKGMKFNIFQFYIHRYLRLTPALAAMVLVTAHLTKYMGSGPYFPSLNSFEESCRKYWWTTLLYVQNYVNKDGSICLPHTWYLSIDMQLYIISPLILIPLWKYAKVGVALVSVEILAFIIVPFCIAYITEVPGLLINLQPRVPVDDYMKKYYIKTHARAAPYFIGALLGFLLAKIKFQSTINHFKLNKFVVVICWAICFAVGLTCIFAGQDTLDGPDYDRVANSFYVALVRPTWALCLCWVVFACVSGYGGPINWLLSLPIYQVLNKFTYSMYLIHYPLLFILIFSTKTGYYFSEVSLAYSFWGITMFTFAASVLWVLAFESPIVILEKVIFGGTKKVKKQAENGDKNGLPA